MTAIFLALKISNAALLWQGFIGGAIYHYLLLHTGFKPNRVPITNKFLQNGLTKPEEYVIIHLISV